MSSFHRCMRKSKVGSNRIIKKDKWCLWPTTSPFWKKSGLVPKSKNKSSLRRQNLTDIAGE